MVPVFFRGWDIVPELGYIIPAAQRTMVPAFFRGWDTCPHGTSLPPFPGGAGGGPFTEPYLLTSSCR